VTPAEQTTAGRVALELARRFPGLDPALLASRPAFRAALGDALDAVEDEATLVAQVLEAGPLTGARSPYGVIVGRLRRLRTLAEQRAGLLDEQTEVLRWRRVDHAARRGETLRQLVEAGTVFPDEARERVAGEFADPDLRGIALAALDGGRP
jgi:hypothetical protein